MGYQKQWGFWSDNWKPRVLRVQRFQCVEVIGYGRETWAGDLSFGLGELGLHQYHFVVLAKP